MESLWKCMMHDLRVKSTEVSSTAQFLTNFSSLSRPISTVQRWRLHRWIRRVLISLVPIRRKGGTKIEDMPSWKEFQERMNCPFCTVLYRGHHVVHLLHSHIRHGAEGTDLLDPRRQWQHRDVHGAGVLHIHRGLDRVLLQLLDLLLLPRYHQIRQEGRVHPEQIGALVPCHIHSRAARGHCHGSVPRHVQYVGEWMRWNSIPTAALYWLSKRAYNRRL